MSSAATALLLAALAPWLGGCSMLPGATSPADASASATAARVSLDDQDFPPVADASLVTCTGSAGLWSASGKVVNPTRSRYTYQVTVDFYDAKGEQVDEVKAAPLPPLPPGRSTGWSATSDGTFPSITTCRIGTVYRTLS